MEKKENLNQEIFDQLDNRMKSAQEHIVKLRYIGVSKEEQVKVTIDGTKRLANIDIKEGEFVNDPTGLCQQIIDATNKAMNDADIGLQDLYKQIAQQTLPDVPDQLKM